MNQLPGITRKDEEERLQKTLAIADEKLQATRQNVKDLADELHTMLEDFDEADKEAQALWNNTDARFQEASKELNRAERARKKPYFGRIDFVDEKIQKDEVYYIGRSVIAKNPSEPEVIDWRAPIATVYYDSNVGPCTYSVKGEGCFRIDLKRKRTYEIENDQLKDFYDSDVVANDELLTKYLAKSKRAVLGEIIATIQQEQNEIIRKKPQHNVLVQGVAGSGKTTVAMHRISYILYNYELEFAPQDFYIIGSNRILLNYITGVLPDLDVYGIKQMTMEQLFVRLLYEDWDVHKFKVKSVDKTDKTACLKGSLAWFQDLENFCREYEWNYLKRNDVRTEKTNTLLLTKKQIEKIIRDNMHLSLADKISKLTEHLMAKLENEISGKYYSYSQDEKKKLIRFYETYFGKREWKGSIFEMYRLFIQEQNEKLHSETAIGEAARPIVCPENEFDVYDLAALAYLYKRIKETEIIREAGHVVIDEAQDFGMMVYSSLKYCLSKCTYTIMGDVSQNIYAGYGLNDWEELKELMLPGEFDYFGLLRKSYRNTVEISNFATDILKHGHFKIYPVEPILRHGNPVLTIGCGDEKAQLEKTVGLIQAYRADGHETIAVICRDEGESMQVSEYLKDKVELLDTNPETTEFGNGVMVLPVEYTKGLEFDAVILYNAGTKQYPADDGLVKLLYVAATRALHELAVLYVGELTELIAGPIPDSAKELIVDKVPEKKRVLFEEEPELTNEERIRRIAREGDVTMREREQIGPRRIEIKPEQLVKNASENDSAVLQEPKKEMYTPMGLHGVTSYQRPVARPAAKRPEKTANNVPYYLQGKQTVEQKPDKVMSEFGEMPDSNGLRPVGHTKADASVKWITKTKNYWDLTSTSGTLRIEPVSDDMIRIRFAKGTEIGEREVGPEIRKNAFSFKCRETRDAAEILTDKILVRVEKRNGAVSFYTPQSRLILREREKEPRQVEPGRSYVYFEFGKSEKLVARGITDGELLKIGASAKYISFGKQEKRMPGIASDQGYELLFPTECKVLCCNISMYGPYVSLDGVNEIEYYFKKR